MIAEKGLPCEERDVSMPLMEHKEPWFMRLNLGEEVPVIIHKDNIISDYNQIIDYMEKNFTGGEEDGGGLRLGAIPGLIQTLLAICPLKLQLYSRRAAGCQPSPDLCALP